LANGVAEHPDDGTERFEGEFVMPVDDLVENEGEECNRDLSVPGRADRVQELEDIGFGEINQPGDVTIERHRPI
jgi:hypothetical protein